MVACVDFSIYATHTFCDNKKISNTIKLILGGRGTGKTEALIKYANKHDALILCPSMQCVRIIQNRANELNLEIRKPEVFGKYFNPKYMTMIKCAYCNNSNVIYG